MALLLVAVAKCQADSSDLNMTVDLGFGGYFRLGFFTPLQVTVENHGAAVSGELRVVTAQGTRLAARQSTVTYRKRIYLPEYSRATLAVTAQLGSAPRPISAMLVDDSGAVLARQEVSVRRAVTMAPVAVVVGSSTGYESLLAAAPGAVSRKVGYVDSGDFPSSWLALQGVGLVVVQGARTLDLSTAQLTALSQWVETGGRLVVADGAGERPSQPQAYAMLPCFIGGSTLPVPSFRGLQAPPGAWVSANTRKTSATSPWKSVDDPRLGSTWRLGQGSVTYIPWDPLGSAFGSWTSEARAWRTLLPPDESGSDSGTSLVDPQAAPQEEPASAQLAPDVGTVYRSRWVVLAFAAVYVAGLLLLLKATAATPAKLSGPFWPLAVMLAVTFSLVGFVALGAPGLRRNTGLTEISTILTTPGERYVSVVSHINGFSPREGTFSMTFRPDVQGLVQTARSEDALPDTEFAIDGPYATARVHLRRWHGFDMVSDSVVPTPVRVDGPRRGVRNGHEARMYTVTNLASQPLTDAHLLFEQSDTPVGTLQPYEARTLSVPLRNREAEMVPVIDADTICGGPSLNREEVANRARAAQALSDTFHAAGPIFVGWFRKPVWDMVKYGGLNLRTSVGLVAAPLNAGAGDEDLGVDPDAAAGEDDLL